MRLLQPSMPVADRWKLWLQAQRVASTHRWNKKMPFQEECEHIFIAILGGEL